MRDRLLSYIRRHQMMRPGDRVGVAVSGGADSVALLRLLLDGRDELGIVPAVVHFNHKIRGADADADEQFVRELAAQFDLEFFSDSADTRAHAAQHKLSLEAAGRELRYQFFAELTGKHPLDRVATAHTRDDQAETVLLRLLRGSWTKGLAGIHPAIGFGFKSKPDQQFPPHVVRPVLEIARAELRAYLDSLHQSWREDVTNADPRFLRNRIRHELLPSLRREYKPRMDEVLCDMAEIARAEEDYWEFAKLKPYLAMVAGHVLELGRLWDTGSAARVSLDPLCDQPLALRRRLVREVFGPAAVDFNATEALVRFASEPEAVGKSLEVPGGWLLTRSEKELTIHRRCPSEEERDYEFVLPVPGTIEIPQAGLALSSTMASSGKRLAPEFAHDLRVRNWRPGDRYWPAHTAVGKKIKELLQARHIPRQYKALWPVVVSGEKLVWVPGFALPADFLVQEAGTEGVRLTELPLPQPAETGP